jgi:hypothetical protein
MPALCNHNASRPGGNDFQKHREKFPTGADRPRAATASRSLAERASVHYPRWQNEPKKASQGGAP